MQDIPQIVLSNPVLLVALTIAILAVVAWQRTLTYREYRTAHKLKTLVFYFAADWARRHGRPLFRTKGGTDDPEFVATYDGTPREAFGRLRASGFSPHLVATTKRRSTGDGYQYTHSQLVYLHTDGTQTEVYLFDDEDGVDVYGHHETAVLDPEGHLSDPQEQGDPTDVIRMALGMPLDLADPVKTGQTDG